MIQLFLLIKHQTWKNVSTVLIKRFVVDKNPKFQNPKLKIQNPKTKIQSQKFKIQIPYT
jgi:hypothetical protein